MADWGQKRSALRQESIGQAPVGKDWGAQKRALQQEQASLRGTQFGTPALPPEQDPEAIQRARQSLQSFKQAPAGDLGAFGGQAARGGAEAVASMADIYQFLAYGDLPQGVQPDFSEGVMGLAEKVGIPSEEETPTKAGMIGRGTGRAAVDTAMFALPAAGIARTGGGTSKVGQFLMGNYLTRGARVGADEVATPTLGHVSREAAKEIGLGAAGGAGGVIGEKATGSKIGDVGGNVVGTLGGVGLFKAIMGAGKFPASVAARVGRSIAGSEKAVATLESLGAGSLANKLKANREVFFDTLGRERAARAIRLASPDPSETLTHISAAEHIARKHPGAKLNLAQATGSANYQTMLDDRVRRSGAFRDQIEKQKQATDSVAFGELKSQYPPQPGGTRVMQKLVQDSIDADLSALRNDLASAEQGVIGMRRNVSSPQNQSEELAGAVGSLVETTRERVNALYEPFNRYGNRIELPAARNRITGWFQQYTGNLGNVEAQSLRSGKAMNNPAVTEILSGDNPLTFADLKASRESINQVLRDSPDLGYTERQLLQGLKSEVDGTLNDMMSSGQFRTDLDPEALTELYVGARRFEDEAWQMTDEAVAAIESGDMSPIAGNYRAANAAYRERKQVLGPESTPAIGKVTGEGRRVRPGQRTPTADVGRKILKPGGDARQRAEQFQQMVQYARASGDGLDQRMQEGARDYLLASAYRDAGFDSGLPNPLALDRWRSEHEAALALFPDVDRHLADVGSARRHFDDRATETAERVARIEKSVASDFVGRPVDEAVDAILNAKGRTPVEAAGEVLARTQGHPDARAGLARAFSERLLANSKRLTTENARDVISGGHVAPDVAKMQDMLTEKEDVLRHVWGSRRYEDTQELVGILNRNAKATKAGTTRELTEAQARQNVQKVSRWAEGARDRLDRPGVIPFGERGARLIDVLSESFPDEYTAKFLERALLDPTAARALLSQGDELIRSEPLRPFRLWMAGVATSALQDMGGEE